jgi:hypothetical protein
LFLFVLLTQGSNLKRGREKGFFPYRKTANKE